ncbi:3-mercaptopyruvate sulfurtransferase [Polymorphum gilvum]|uniref:3-mercaptopyruvate sulfurtransferase n=1 Tax=Polymorphum gilvum (strain LMG 25793 / CGMCC 1.9160 / SL003B-26A1) TaxID=991905 RepID=F2IXB8_POLGS|nr:3-mercaptopyruvate sulfurtransferase [Polymorphum gilvum]ADZ70436.1 Thiosulfate sulfurtransferase, Rhodanese-like protein [Polymorphum gilvum SL003B-26A1]
MPAFPLVSTAWLADHLEAPDVVVVDASYHLPTAGRDADAEYRAEHIPGAVRFDIDAVSDPASDLPHMLPQPHVFSSRMRKLGIGDGQTIVVYDSVGCFSAPRAWWMFKVMGVGPVFVLDGGLPKWKAEGRPVDDAVVARPDRHFTARLDHGAVADLAAMRRIVADGNCQVVDARPAGRFAGTDPEPRPGLRGGHMPGAFNMPSAVFTAEDGTFLPPEQLRAVFAGAGVDLDRPVTTSCGSGVTAAVITLALTVLGHRDHNLYDGSWTEWGGRQDTEVVTD